MTTKTPEALAVLDRVLPYIEGLGGITADFRKARAAFAELTEQMRDVLMLWDSEAWSIDAKAAAVQCRPDKWRKALAAVEGMK